ncbi:MAG: adenosine deaminase [Lachnospiraceae bacterium]|nr:adenosine deaminase [Lachnospiraceae bacterium]MDD3617377.1 adenosine deaminase [Lachnospiraceae bacterium]
MEENRIASLPKVDLHCHLDGSLPVQMVQSMLGKQITPQNLQVSADCRNLAEYLEKFDLPLQCMQTAEGLRRSAMEFLLDVAKEHTAYVEVRFAPLFSENENLSCRQVIESVLEGLELAKKQCGVSYNVIVCAMRNHSEEENLRMLRTAREYLGNGVCAADLAGNEAAYPMKEFASLFKQAAKWEIPFTIHAGECGSKENIREAIELGAKRIGHGIAMRGDKSLQQLCAQKCIGVEMCPTSNLQTRAVKDETEYPLEEFEKNQVLVTINTDNRTVSDTTITKELLWVEQYCNQSDEDIRKLMKNAVEVSFASEEEKHRLWKMYSGLVI